MAAKNKDILLLQLLADIEKVCRDEQTNPYAKVESVLALAQAARKEHRQCLDGERAALQLLQQSTQQRLRESRQTMENLEQMRKNIISDLDKYPQ